MFLICTFDPSGKKTQNGKSSNINKFSGTPLMLFQRETAHALQKPSETSIHVFSCCFTKNKVNTKAMFLVLK